MPVKKVSDLIPVIDQVFTESLLEFGFTTSKTEKDKFFVKRYFACNDRYIAVSLNFHPRDGQPYLNLILGEGSLNWPDSDWNSIALWHLQNHISASTTGSEYVITLDNAEDQLRKAQKDLLAYHAGFLTGNLAVFNLVRKQVNSARTPYQILTPDKDGKYSTRDEETSKKLKAKYS